MAKEKASNQYQSKSDVEKYLKSDKTFMTTRSAAEFDAFIEGAMWMMKQKQLYIDRLVDRCKNDAARIIELSNELAPYKELYENYDFVEKRSKKTKKKVTVQSGDIDDYDTTMEFQDDDYGDITGEDFED